MKRVGVALLTFALLAISTAVAQSISDRHIVISYCGSQFQLRLPATHRVKRKTGADYRQYTVTKSDVEPSEATFTITLTTDPYIGPVISGETEAAEILGAKTNWFFWSESKNGQKVFHRELLVGISHPRKQEPASCRKELRMILSVSGSDYDQVQKMSGLAGQIVYLNIANNPVLLDRLR
jgi:hypothetical protein